MAPTPSAANTSAAGSLNGTAVKKAPKPPKEKKPGAKQFICKWEECRRIFGKLEHLQRHERSHAGELPFQCQVCEKRFARSDVLQRHATLHNGGKSTISKKTRKVACASCSTLKLRCDGSTPCERCKKKDLECLYSKTAPQINNSRTAGGSASISTSASAAQTPSRPSTTTTSAATSQVGDSSTTKEDKKARSIAAVPVTHPPRTFSPNFISQPAPAMAESIDDHDSPVSAMLASPQQVPTFAYTSTTTSARRGSFMRGGDDMDVGGSPMMSSIPPDTRSALPSPQLHPFLNNPLPQIDVSLDHNHNHIDASVGWFNSYPSSSSLNNNLHLQFDLPPASEYGFQAEAFGDFSSLNNGFDGYRFREDLPSQLDQFGNSTANNNVNWSAQIGMDSLSTNAPNTPAQDWGTFPSFGAGLGEMTSLINLEAYGVAAPESDSEEEDMNPDRKKRKREIDDVDDNQDETATRHLPPTPTSSGISAASLKEALEVWPHIYEPKVGDNDLPIPDILSLPDAASCLGHPILDLASSNLLNASVALPPTKLSEEARQAVLDLVAKTHTSAWPEVDVSSFPSIQTLSVCIQLYFVHFHPIMPIIHQPSFKITEKTPLLLLSVAAIGAMYSPELKGLAVAMNELCRRSLVWIRENDRTRMYDMDIVQAWLLNSLFGIYCGSRKLYQHSEVSRGGLVVACRRMHLLRPSPSIYEEIRAENRGDLDSIHEVWKNEEERRRLGWGIYLYDVQIACLLNIPSQMALGEVGVCLPSSDESFAATNSTLWASSLLQSHGGDPSSDSVFTGPIKSSPLFLRVLDSLLTTGKLGDNMSLNRFGSVIISYTLYRLCADACNFHLVLPSFSNPETAHSQYKLCFPVNVKHNPQELMDLLAKSWYTEVSTPPNYEAVLCSALSHHGHLVFDQIGFLDEVKIAAGKKGLACTRERAQNWLRGWLEQDRVTARRILRHATQLQAHLTRLSFDSPAESIWMFDSAIVIWAIVKFGPDLTICQGRRHKTNITWSDSSTLDSWEVHGGPATLQGLGDLSYLNSAKILTTNMEALSKLSWSLSQNFREVLEKLLKEEEEIEFTVG